MSGPRPTHVKALEHLMQYVVATKDRGLVLEPTRIWDGIKDFEFNICGRSDLDYTTNPDDRRSVSGEIVFLEDCPVVSRSATQKPVCLSLTEAEGSAGVSTAQDMVYIYCLIIPVQCKVVLPMVLEMDNKGAVDLANNMSVVGRTHHYDVR